MGHVSLHEPSLTSKAQSRSQEARDGIADSRRDTSSSRGWWGSVPDPEWTLAYWNLQETPVSMHLALKFVTVSISHTFNPLRNF